MKKFVKNKKLVLFILGFLSLILIVITTFIFRISLTEEVDTGTSSPQNPTDNPTLDEGEVEIIGQVVGISDECIVDGDCTITIETGDDKTYEILTGAGWGIGQPCPKISESREEVKLGDELYVKGSLVNNNISCIEPEINGYFYCKTDTLEECDRLAKEQQQELLSQTKTTSVEIQFPRDEVIETTIEIPKTISLAYFWRLLEENNISIERINDELSINGISTEEGDNSCRSNWFIDINDNFGEYEYTYFLNSTDLIEPGSEVVLTYDEICN